MSQETKRDQTIRQLVLYTLRLRAQVASNVGETLMVISYDVNPTELVGLDQFWTLVGVVSVVPTTTSILHMSQRPVISVDVAIIAQFDVTQERHAQDQHMEHR